MKKGDSKPKNQLEKYKKNQKARYIYFEIPDDVFEKTFQDVSRSYQDEDEMLEEHNRLIQKYIINEISNGNNKMYEKVINYFSPIKIIIIKNKKYDISREKIDKSYEKAIKLLKYKYNEKESINMNILINMKYIIDNNYIDTQINKMGIQIYDISFLKEYIRKMNIDQIEFSKEIGISNNELNMLLNGEIKATIDIMETICIYFDVENIEELKRKMEKDMMNKKINVEEIKEKLKEKTKKSEPKGFKIKNEEKYYNLSFMKEYVDLYNIRKDNLAQIFSCGLKKVDEILNGNIWIKESIMSDVYIEYRVKDFSEFKEKILNYIKKYKLNDLKTKLKLFSEKYINLQITEESLVDLMPKELLILVLDLNNMEETDRKIVKLLFKIGFNEEYTYDDIAMILEVDRQRVIKLYKDNLKKVIDLLKESQNNIYILKQ